MGPQRAEAREMRDVEQWVIYLRLRGLRVDTSSATVLAALFDPASLNPAGLGRLHCAPVGGLFEGVRDGVDGGFVVPTPDEHHADRQSVAHGAGY